MSKPNESPDSQNQTWDPDNIDYDEVRRFAGLILVGKTFDELAAAGRIKERWQADCFKMALSDPDKYSNYYPESEVGAAVISDEFLQMLLEEFSKGQSGEQIDPEENG